jgi:hypothetical protein
VDIPDWLANNIGGVTVGQIIVWVVVVALAGYGIRKIWPGLKAIVHFAELWAQLRPFMDRTDESVAKLERQILNNHPEDSNMREEITEAKDAAKRAVELAEGLHGRVDVLEASNERQEQSIAGLRDDVSDVQQKLTKDHDRLSVLEENTLPKDQIHNLVEQADDEPTK